MWKTQLELQDGNENVKDMESFKIFTIFGVGSFSTFNIAVNFNREVFMIMIFIFLFFTKNNFN